MDDPFSIHPADPLPDRLKPYLSEMARRELDGLRKALDQRLAALESALAHPDGLDEPLETLVIELARVATAEAEAAAARACLDAQLHPTTRGGASLAEVQQALEAERMKVELLRGELEQMQVSLQAESDASAARQRELSGLRATHEREMTETRAALERERSLSAQRAQEIERTRLALQAERDAHAAFRSTADDTRQALQAAQRAVYDERDARAAVNAQLMEERAGRSMRDGELSRERAAKAQLAETIDVLQRRVAELEKANADEREGNAGRQAADNERLAAAEKALEAATDRIRELELQLFAKGRGNEQDEELAAQLAAPVDPATQPIRAASRYSFASGIAVEINGEVGALVDLSVAGAQLASAKALTQSDEVDVVLLSDEVPVSCTGRVVWTRLEPQSQGRPLRYRAGLAFTQIDTAAVEAFIIRYAAPQKPGERQPET